MTPTALCGHRCPRWDELPALGLYLDQVMLVLQDALAPFSAGQEKGVITPTIINNYVKQRVLAPTQKKKYDRSHLADLVMLLLLKRVLTTAELVQTLYILKQGRTPQAAYDGFCDALERQLAGQPPADDTPPLVLAALQALAGRLAFEAQLAALPAAAPQPPPPAAQERAKKKKDKGAAAVPADVPPAPSVDTPAAKKEQDAL